MNDRSQKLCKGNLNYTRAGMKKRSFCMQQLNAKQHKLTVDRKVLSSSRVLTIDVAFVKVLIAEECLAAPLTLSYGECYLNLKLLYQFYATNNRRHIKEKGKTFLCVQ